MLLPALQSARERARTSNCVSNLTQWGKALNIYIDAFDGYFIPQNMALWKASTSTRVWSDYNAWLRYYCFPNATKEIWGMGYSINGCPSVVDSTSSYEACNSSGVPIIKTISPTSDDIKEGRGLGSRYWSYGHNTSLMGNIDKNDSKNSKLYKQNWLNNPSKYFAFADSYTNNFSHKNYLHNYHRRLTSRHLGKKALNVVFADGHVETIIDEQLNYDNSYKEKIHPRLTKESRNTNWEVAK